MTRKLVLLTLVTLVYCISYVHSCPKAEEIYPCNCKFPHYGLDLLCKDVKDVKYLSAALKSVENEKIGRMTFENVQVNLTEALFKNLGVITLIFRDSQINFMDVDNVFAGLENSLENLEFEKTNIPLKKDGKFKISHLESLKTLLIKGQSLEHVRNFSIDSSSSLQELKIEGNLLKTIDSYAFANLKDLVKFELIYNEITDFERCTLPRPAEKLTEISLSDNKIKKLRSDIFEEMPVLNKAVFTSNKIETINKQILSPVRKNLKELWLYLNPFHCDTAFKDLVSAYKEISFIGACTTEDMFKRKSFGIFKH